MEKCAASDAVRFGCGVADLMAMTLTAGNRFMLAVAFKASCFDVVSLLISTKEQEGELVF